MSFRGTGDLKGGSTIKRRKTRGTIGKGGSFFLAHILTLNPKKSNKDGKKQTGKKKKMGQ